MTCRLSSHRTNSTAIPAANSSPAPPTITAARPLQPGERTDPLRLGLRRGRASNAFAPGHTVRVNGSGARRSRGGSDGGCATGRDGDR